MENRYQSSSWDRRRRWVAGVTALCALLITGCETTPERPAIHLTGDPIIDGKAELAAAPAKDRVLWDYRIAASAMRASQFDEAKARLDDAIAGIGGIIANDETAKKARGLFTGESSKTFIGEPYERVMCYYYRGILYWRDGEPDNARACFRSGQFIDSDAESDDYKSDYVLLDYLDGYASVKEKSDGDDAFQRAQKLTKLTLQPYDPSANVLCFVEFGRGPKKYGAGEYGEQLKFILDDSKVRSASLTIAGQEATFVPMDDLNFQATTRGGRVMDHILGRKAVFKSTTDTIGNVALVGAAVAASQIYKEKPPQPRRPGERRQEPEYEKSDNAQTAAIALGVVGVLSKLTAAATTPKADTRTWNNLPQYLSFGVLRVPPGEYPARLEFLDAQGKRIESLAQTLQVKVGKPGEDTVLFLSELKR